MKNILYKVLILLNIVNGTHVRIEEKFLQIKNTENGKETHIRILNKDFLEIKENYLQMYNKYLDEYFVGIYKNFECKGFYSHIKVYYLQMYNVYLDEYFKQIQEMNLQMYESPVENNPQIEEMNLQQKKKEYFKLYGKKNREKKKKYLVSYRKKNKEILKLYREKNKEEIKLYREVYYEKKKTYIKERVKKYYEKNREKILICQKKRKLINKKKSF